MRLRSSPDRRAAPDVRINSYLVLIPVLVKDAQDRLITGLDKGHFRVFEDKVEQTITQFTQEDAPLSVAVVFDCSGSMGRKLQTSRQVVAEFLNSSNTEDEFALIEFSDRAQLTVGLTTEAGQIPNRLMAAESKGSTALLDAIYLAMNELQHAKHSRRAILIISDGGDNCSRYTAREVKNRVREADVQIFSIAVTEGLTVRGRSVEELLGPGLLQEIAETSGGWLHEIEDMSGMADAAAKIGLALRQQYVLGYSPSSLVRDGKYHRVRVKVDGQDVTRLRLSFRTGYVAPSY